MNKEEILKAIRGLAMSQGFYGRLYEKLIDGSSESNELIEKMVEENFKDVVDMVMWLES